MKYIDENTLEYPIYFWSIKERHPNRSIPKPPAEPDGYGLVHETPLPDHDSLTQIVTEGTPQKVNGQWVQVWNVTDMTPEDSAKAIQDAIDAARKSAHGRVNSEYERRTGVLGADYPENEQKSWPVQVMEAETVLGADDKPTPWVDAASTARGITRQEMATLIKAQDTTYRQYHGQLSGIRQALRDQIDAVPDGERSSIDTLNAINWPDMQQE